MPKVMPENVYLVVLAGGSGTRFWPKSRHLSPKQLCRIGNAELTMIEQTLQRFADVIPPKRRVIVTHVEQMAGTQKIVGDLCQTILPEPAAKNTAAALALGSLEIDLLHKSSGHPEPAIMISVHADHIIQNVDAFINDLHRAVEVASTGQLTLLGVEPEYPETGYGYIEEGESLPNMTKASRVASFKEKPDLATANSYLERGGFLWNSGLFVWQTQDLMSELHKFLPSTAGKLEELVSDFASVTDISFADLSTVYESLDKVAIDNAVLEKSDKVSVLSTAFGWKDVGSWDALAQIFPVDDRGNYRSGDCFIHDCKNVTIDSDGPFIATIGCENLVVVASGGAVMVCPAERAQDVKKVVEHLKSEGRSDYL